MQQCSCQNVWKILLGIVDHFMDKMDRQHQNWKKKRGLTTPNLRQTWPSRQYLLFHQFISVNQMVACNIILVSMVVLLLSIGVEPSIWGTKTTEFASDKKKVFETFVYTEKAICFSKWNSHRKFFKNFLWILHVSRRILIAFCQLDFFFLVLKWRSC